MEDAILEHVHSYLRGQENVNEFQDWFVPATWNINQTSNRDAIAMSRRIGLRLAEFLNGHWTEHELKDRLAEMLIARRDPVTVFIEAAHGVGNMTIQEPGETSSYDLRPREVTLYIGLGHTPQEPALLPSTAGRIARIDTGRTLAHRG
jgi:hypothetical protein